MSISRKAGLPLIWAAALSLLAGCGGISEAIVERVDRSETIVQQSEQTIGRSEAGALELQRAKEHLRQAQEAVEDGDNSEAEQHAELAQLHAELAVATSQTASLRKAADELQASIQTLRREAGLSASDLQ